MGQAVIYCRVDSQDRSVMPAQRTAAEAFCSSQGWSFTHFTDSASGNRPPLQFATASQLIRPGLTRLLSAVEAGSVAAVVPGTADALATSAAVKEKLASYLEDHGFRQAEGGPAGFYFVKQ